MRTSLEMVSQFVSDENLHSIPMVLIDICDKFEEWERHKSHLSVLHCVSLCFIKKTTNIF